MPIEIKMPALSPTMEEGTLAKWLVKVGDAVKPGDILAEIETDKATVELEAVDQGTIADIAVAEGTDGVKAGTGIATLSEDGEGAPLSPAPAEAKTSSRAQVQVPIPTPHAAAQMTERALRSQEPLDAPAPPPSLASEGGIDRVKASPLARRLAAARDIDLVALTGSGPNGRIVRADLRAAQRGEGNTSEATQPDGGVQPPPGMDQAPAVAPSPKPLPEVPHAATKLSNIRKTIARRLTESKQQVPHIYLTVDVRLDALLGLRGDLNATLEARGVKLSVNDLLVKALALALMEVPACNVMFTPDQLISFKRADVSVAVSTPTGLITPVVAEADTKSVSRIATEIKELAELARDGKLKPEQYQGGTASISNMGMYGIKQFDAVINPPQAMILAVRAGEQRPHVIDGQLGVATVMSATGSFDHRAIDGADGAAFMRAFKALVERPLLLTV